MTDDNPYAPPKFDLNLSEDVVTSAKLAHPFTRFSAAIADTLIGLCYSIPLMFPLGIWEDISSGRNPPVGRLISYTVLGFLGFLLVHGYLLMKNGQTIGKYLAGIRIADLRGNTPDFARLILLRYVPMTLMASIPVVGGFLSLIDVLFIFRSDHRCVHDLLAGTKVVIVKKPGW
jgi:uncharacterized RDD family membrane protein YckC